jgi:hypothetical protein
MTFTQVLHDPFLDLVQSVVVLVQNSLGADNVEVVLGLFVPGKGNEVIDVGDADRVLG